MTQLTHRFVTPLDVLFLRGNQSFGDPGSYGDSVMPPWPSVAAGAIRSRILVDDGVDLAAFAQGKAVHEYLGTPEQPGSFVLHACHVARRTPTGIELLIAPPADLFISNDEHSPGQVRIQRLQPIELAAPLATSNPLPCVPVLAQSSRGKPASGWWLNQNGWQQYLLGNTPNAADLLHASALWAMDERVGVGLSADTRSAEDGKLFSNRAVALKPGVGFVFAVRGAHAPTEGLLRLGGDGRAAAIESVQLPWPEPDYQAIAQAGRCRMVLTSPGLFSQGWLPNGCTQNSDGSIQFQLHGVTGNLVAASVARNETISGWDLASRQPKPAQRVAATGSVYWLEQLQASPEALRKLADHGLWSQPCEDAIRRAEGFNRISLAPF